jgi:glyoxylase I family protein
MQIKSIHHISLIVADTKRALAFYQGTLGLPLAERPALSFPGAWLTVGGQQIHLLELPNPDPTTGRPDHAGEAGGAGHPLHPQPLRAGGHLLP